MNKSFTVIIIKSTKMMNKILYFFGFIIFFFIGCLVDKNLLPTNLFNFSCASTKEKMAPSDETTLK